MIGHNYIPSEILQATQSLTLCNNTEKSGNIFLLSAMLVIHTGEPYHCTMPIRLSPPVPESKIEVCSPCYVPNTRNQWLTIGSAHLLYRAIHVYLICIYHPCCVGDQGCIEYLNLPQRTPVSGNTLVFVSVYHIH